LFPPNEEIGERPCINQERCLARFIAQVRYGPNTDMAFTCKEFLLPDQHEAFLAGKGLPQRRGKCLLCHRYFTNYLYILVRPHSTPGLMACRLDWTGRPPLRANTQARTDPNFRVADTSLGMQIFCNAVAMPKPRSSEEQSLQDAAKEVPTHASSISTSDGYLPSAMLYVDEDFTQHRCAREDKIAALTWRPQVRFCSSHYKYVKDEEGLRIVQVGIGVDGKGHESAFQCPPGAVGPEGEARPRAKGSSAKRP